MFTPPIRLRTRAALLLALAAATLCTAAPAFAKDYKQVSTQQVHTFGIDEGHQGRTPLLQAADGRLYGVTLGGGGTALHGTLFRIDPSGHFETIQEFSGSETVGGQPGSAPIQGSDGSLYGTTQLGGAFNYGTVYRIDANGVHTTLHSFVPSNPSAIVSDTWLVQGPDAYLYGVSRVDGEFDAGSVFRLRPDGGDYTVLHSFSAGAGGREPWGSLLVGQDGQLYGTTRFGGNNDCGTIFRIKRNAAFTVLNSLCNGGEGDPAYPAADLIQDAGGVFYGTTEFGGSYGAGTVFRRTPDGAIETLHSFSKRDPGGYGPTARLVRDADGVLYGVTRFGGDKGRGTSFALAPDGRLARLHSFGEIRRDGRYPWGPLIQASDGNFYGMTAGGSERSFFGTIYRMVPTGTGQRTGLTPTGGVARP